MCSFVSRGRSVYAEPMADELISWRHDFDKALSDTAASSRDLLLDFTAAPM